MGHPAKSLAILVGEWQGLRFIRHIRNSYRLPMADGSLLILTAVDILFSWRARSEPEGRQSDHQWQDWSHFNHRFDARVLRNLAVRTKVSAESRKIAPSADADGVRPACADAHAQGVRGDAGGCAAGRPDPTVHAHAGGVRHAYAHGHASRGHGR